MNAFRQPLLRAQEDLPDFQPNLSDMTSDSDDRGSTTIHYLRLPPTDTQKG
jgi:hypothetical protein